MFKKKHNITMYEAHFQCLYIFIMFYNQYLLYGIYFECCSSTSLYNFCKDLTEWTQSVQFIWTKTKLKKKMKNKINKQINQEYDQIVQYTF